MGRRRPDDIYGCPKPDPGPEGVFVASGADPDDVRTWYEVPEEVSEMVTRHAGGGATFAERVTWLCILASEVMEGS